jgi:hypothetical protein
VVIISPSYILGKIAILFWDLKGEWEGGLMIKNKSKRNDVQDSESRGGSFLRGVLSIRVRNPHACLMC